MDLEGLNELGRHVLSVFQEFESRFLGVATLEVTRPPERDGPVLSLRPERIGAARVEAEILQREVDLYVEGSEFAFQLRRREDPSALTDSVRQVLAAVTEGKFEKTVWEIRAGRSSPKE